MIDASHFNFDDAQVSLESLELDKTRVSLEAGVFSQALSTTATGFSQFFDKAKLFFARAFDQKAGQFRQLNSSELERLTRPLNYLDLVQLKVHVPIGFNTSYLAYAKLLGEAQEHAEQLQNGLLKPFAQYLGEVINDPDRLRALGSSGFKRSFANCDQFKRRFEHALNHKGRVQATLGDVLTKIGEIPEVTRLGNNVAGRYTGIDNAQLTKQLASITELLDVLIEALKEDPDNYKASGATIKLLSETVYDIAREVEFYSFLGYQIKTYTEAVGDTWVDLVRFLK